MMTKRLLTPTVVALATLITTTALADEARRPLRPAPVRENTIAMDRYETTRRIERIRTADRTRAVFSADAQQIDESAIMIFEAHSVSKHGVLARWRCVAIDDVSECLATPVRIRYLPADTKVVFTAIAKPKNSPEAVALIQAQNSVHQTLASR